MPSFFSWRSRRKGEGESDALAWLDDADHADENTRASAEAERYAPPPPPQSPSAAPQAGGTDAGGAVDSNAGESSSEVDEGEGVADGAVAVADSVVATTEVPIRSRRTSEAARRRTDRGSVPVVGESGQPTIIQRVHQSAELSGSAPTTGLGSEAKPGVADSDATYQPKEKEYMSQIDTFVSEMLDIEGATGAAIVDISSGMALATGGHPGFDLNVAAAGNSNVVRAKLSTMNDIGVAGCIEDIMITLSDQYHLISVLNSSETEGLFIYLVLDRKRANLALARHKVNQIAKKVSV